ncbi:MAG: hypothetical protein ACREK8_10380 [Gemmatimonadales bacterium]
MSRAFAPKDDPPDPPRPTYRLPDRSDPGYAAESAAALLEGARAADVASAEEASGYQWGDPALIPQVERMLEDARRKHDDRLEQVALRYLKAARPASQR